MPPCPNVQLERYQTAPAEWLIRNPNQRGIALLFPTGFGKTLSAVACVLELWKVGRIDSISVISPKSLKANLKGALEKCGGADATELANRVKSFTYEAVESKPSLLDDVGDRTALIVDEAHKLRDANTGRYAAIRPVAARAHCVILLTATPYVNRTGDTANILGLIDPTIPKCPSDAPQPSLNQVMNFSRHLVAFPDVDKSSEFAQRIDIEEMVELDAVQGEALERYTERFFGSNKDKNENAYFNKTRQISIAVPPHVSTKLLALKRNLAASGNLPALVFSTYVNNSGVRFISQKLAELLPGVRIDVFTGSLSEKNRAELVRRVNNGELDVLILSDSGAEGLDFKGVRSVHHLHAEWHPAAVEQKTGRAIRFRAHAHLPESQRKVKVFRYVSVPKRTFWQWLTGSSYQSMCDNVFPTPPQCTELTMYGIEKRKREEMEKVTEILLNNAIPVGLEAAVGRKRGRRRVLPDSMPTRSLWTAPTGATYKIEMKTKGASRRKRWTQRRTGNAINFSGKVHASITKSGIHRAYA